MKKKLDNHSPSNNKDKVSIEAKFSTNEVEARQTKGKSDPPLKKYGSAPQHWMLLIKIQQDRFLASKFWEKDWRKYWFNFRHKNINSSKIRKDKINLTTSNMYFLLWQKKKRKWSQKSSNNVWHCNICTKWAYWWKSKKIYVSAK